MNTLFSILAVACSAFPLSAQQNPASIREANAPGKPAEASS